jgi:hypothetical protein
MENATCSLLLLFIATVQQAKLTVAEDGIRLHPTDGSARIAHLVQQRGLKVVQFITYGTKTGYALWQLQAHCRAHNVCLGQYRPQPLKLKPCS